MKRHRLRRGLLHDFGDGESAPCAMCGVILTDETMTIDRYPICGWDGGKYHRDNVRPACRECNEADGAQRVRERTWGLTYKLDLVAQGATLMPVG